VRIEGEGVMRRMMTMSVILAVPVLLSAPTRGLTVECIGDCNGDGFVRIEDLLTATAVVLGARPLNACPGLDQQSGEVGVANVVSAINDALNGCVVRHVDYVIGGTYNSINESFGVLALDLVRRGVAVDHWAVGLSFSPHGSGGPGTITASGTADYVRDEQLLTFDLQAQLGVSDPFPLTGEGLWEPPALDTDGLRYSYFESNVQLSGDGFLLDFIGHNPLFD
jgi:hypothetical protein